MSAQSAVRAADFVDTIGVTTHIDYTDGQYRDIKADLEALKYLGIDHVRDASPLPSSDPFGQGHLGDAADAGIKFTFFAQGDQSPATVVARLHAFAAAHPGSIAAIEGPNEVNNWPVAYNGQSGTAGAQAYQKALFDAVNADSLLKNVPVLGFTDYPVHASASDWNNLHPYPKNGDEPRDAILSGKTEQDAVDPGKPFAITEGGYHTSLGADTNGGWEGVDEATQAKLSLNFYMDAAQLGSKLTNQYQLLDAYPDRSGGADQETHFGLFRLDGSAKPAATAIHNLTTILHDGGAGASSFTAGTLNYSTTGLPSTGHTYLTEKSDGSFQIVAWNEPDVWDEKADHAIAVPASTVKLQLGQTFATVQVFDPLQGSGAVKTLHDVSSIDIALTDHPLVVQVSGATAAQPPVPAPPVPTPPPAAPPPTPPATEASLVLRVSADSYKGDPKFIVKVDGHQVGGVMSTHASHAAGQHQDITLTGNFGSSPASVSVQFINDTWGGTAATDRNLYVEQASLNGHVYSPDRPILTSNGTSTISLSGAAVSLMGDAKANTLIGNGAANTLHGLGGNDTLDGKGGADHMIGGSGSDIAYVDNAGDVVDEAADGGSGTDIVRAAISVSLADTVHFKGQVEAVQIQGSGNINATGNALANTLTGNSGSNKIVGGGGDDTIAGHLGNDTLTGGSGSDKFLFDTPANTSKNVDHITDFSVPSDSIHLENAVFTHLASGKLPASEFVVGTGAHDSNDHIVYNPGTGALYYDSNGSAAGGSTEFATVATGLALTSADFFVV